MGDSISIQSTTLPICRISCALVEGEWIYTYQIGSKTLAAQKKEYNKKITGMPILGTVLATEGETVKLHLDIDKEQEISSAYAYPWRPPSGNMMYLMPKEGSRVSLYFSSEEESEAVANTCVRTNGGSSCPEMADSNKRYLTTEHGKQMAMLPKQLGFSGTGSQDMPLSIFLEEEEGLVLQSHRKIAMTALEGVQLEARHVVLNSASEFTASRVMPLSIPSAEIGAMAMVEPLASMNMALSSQQNLLGNTTAYCGWEFLCYPPFDDAPKKGSMNWGKLLLGVAAGLAAVVAATALVATGAIFVCGALALSTAATSAVVGGTIAGGLLVGGMYVGKQAVQDINSGNASGVGSYIKEGAIGATTGAVSGALTPILGPISTPIVHGIVGGATYAGEWAVHNAMGEEEPWNWMSFGLNVGFSALGGSISRVISNRVTAKALAKGAEEGASAAASKGSCLSDIMSWMSKKQGQLMDSDFVTTVYNAGNKTGVKVANTLGGKEGIKALSQLGSKVDGAILKGIGFTEGGRGGRKYYTDYDEWLKSLTPDEINAIKIYTGGDYKMLNQYLRGQIDQLPSHLNQDIIDNINKALNKMQTVTPCTVYRGTGIYDDIEKYFTYDMSKNLTSVDGLIGQTIPEQAFLSTSTNPRASFNHLNVKYQQVLMEH